MWKNIIVLSLCISFVNTAFEEKPTVIVRKILRLAVEGSATLICTSGTKPVDVAWTANDIDVKNSKNDSRVRISSDGNLVLESAKFQDAGTYACYDGKGVQPLSVYQLDVVSADSENLSDEQEAISKESSAGESHSKQTIIEEQPEDDDDKDDEKQPTNDEKDERVDSTLEKKIFTRLVHVENAATLLKSNVDSRLDHVEYKLSSLLKTFQRRQRLSHASTDPGILTTTNGDSTSSTDVVADQRAENGQYVMEYTWILSGVSDAMAKGARDSSYFLQSGPFYTHRPGYRMRVLFYPNFGGRNASGLFAGLLSGEYDGILPWPFPHDYRLGVVSHLPNVVDDTATIRHSATNCSPGVFKRPRTQNPAACGFEEFFTHEKFQKNRKAYVIYDNLVIRITIYSGP